MMASWPPALALKHFTQSELCVQAPPSRATDTDARWYRQAHHLGILHLHPSGGNDLCLMMGGLPRAAVGSIHAMSGYDILKGLRGSGWLLIIC